MKEFVKPEIDVVKFSEEDIIVTSGSDSCDPDCTTVF